MICTKCYESDFYLDPHSNTFVCNACYVDSGKTPYSNYQSVTTYDVGVNLKCLKDVRIREQPTTSKKTDKEAGDDSTRPTSSWKLSELFTWLIREQVESLILEPGLIQDPEGLRSVVWRLWFRYLNVTGEFRKKEKEANLRTVKYELGWGLLYEPNEGQDKLRRRRRTNRDLVDEPDMADDASEPDPPTFPEEAPEEHILSDDDRDSVLSSLDSVSDENPDLDEDTVEKVQPLRVPRRQLFWRGRLSACDQGDRCYLMEYNLAVIYLALQMTDYSTAHLMPVSSLIDRVNAKSLPFIEITSQVPQEFKIHDVTLHQLIRRRMSPSCHVMTKVVYALWEILGLSQIPRIPVLRVIHLYVDRLGLPREIHGIAANMVRRWLDKTQTGHLFTPKNSRDLVPDRMAMAHVVLAMRFVLALDDKTEMHVSDLCHRVNQITSGAPTLFRWTDYVSWGEAYLMPVTMASGGDHWDQMCRVSSVAEFLGDQEWRTGDIGWGELAKGKNLILRSAETKTELAKPFRDAYDMSMQDSQRDPREVSGPLKLNEVSPFRDHILEPLLHIDSDYRDSYRPQPPSQSTSQSVMNSQEDMFGPLDDPGDQFDTWMDQIGSLSRTARLHTDTWTWTPKGTSNSLSWFIDLCARYSYCNPKKLMDDVNSLYMAVFKTAEFNQCSGSADLFRSFCVD